MSKETAMNKYEARALLASKQVETFTNHRLLCLYNQLALRNVLITLTSNQVETTLFFLVKSLRFCEKMQRLTSRDY